MLPIFPVEELDARWNPTLATLYQAGLANMGDDVQSLVPPLDYADAVSNTACDLMLRYLVQQMAEMAMDETDPREIKVACEDELLRISDEALKFAVGVCNCAVGD